jgi:diacylglycerol kinase family enzyme
MTPLQRDVVVHALGSNAKLEVAETSNRGHAAAIACRAMRDGVDVVVALGGDGTVNEVVNGLLTDGIHPQVPVLGIVPAGSTNVFARSLGLPNDAVEATAVLIDALANNRLRTVSLGRADERWFVFAAGLGFDAAVVASVESQRRRGKKSTHARYLRTIVATYAAKATRQPTFSVELPDDVVIEDIRVALVTNNTPWTFLGNRPLAPTPRASLEQGLDVYLRRRMDIPSILWTLGRMIRQTEGHLRLGDRVEHDLAEFRLTATTPLPFQLDGDFVDERMTVQFRNVPGALQVAV